MKSDFEKKTAELIELANETTEEVGKVEAADKKKAAIEVPDVPAKKKKGKAGKVILAIALVIFALIAALAGAGCGIISYATADELPEATPAATKDDLMPFIKRAAVEMVKDKQISVDTSIINYILNTVKDSVNNSAPEELIQINELFSEIKDGQGTIYARAYIGTIEVKGFKIKVNKVVPVKADFNISFNNETKDIVVEIGEVKCGKITIPRNVILTALAAVELPEDMKVDENGNILYNTSGLDAMIDEAVSEIITSSVEEVTSDMNGFLGNLLNNLAENVAGAVTKRVNVELTDANTNGDKLVIKGEIF